LGKQGKEELADYFSSLANDLAAHALYQETCTPYVPPTQPPLDIPDCVIPLPSVDVPRATAAITIDGKPDEPAWQSAARLRLCYTNQGDPAPVTTTAMLLHDQSRLYAAFVCAEPEAGKIRSEVAKRDGPTFYDDSVEVFDDPTLGQRDYFHFSTNALGTQFDQKVLNAGWNGTWQSAASVGDGKWSAEIAIPFEALGVSAPTSGTRWGLNLTRNRTVTGKIEYLTWAAPYGGFHSPDRFGEAVFQ
jgi:hypothetical protein